MIRRRLCGAARARARQIFEKLICFHQFVTPFALQYFCFTPMFWFRPIFWFPSNIFYKSTLVLTLSAQSQDLNPIENLCREAVLKIPQQMMNTSEVFVTFGNLEVCERCTVLMIVT